MGKVLIIKNNNSDERIHRYAMESYEQGKKCYYNSVDGTLNEQALMELKKNFEGSGIVLMITYENSDLRKIKDVFIGDEAYINHKNSIEYIMRVYLKKTCHERVIASIIDKIDLDIDADFGYGQYVIMNDMESLFYELRERIIANKQEKTYDISEKEEKLEEKYGLSALAQKDEQSVRIYPSDSVGKDRTEFQRDRERVVNCKAFRRLVDKAQIFGSEKGDYYRTRMTHSLEVNQIAKAIAYALKLNLDLTEAIALGHDLGHTPFGHQGERTLDEILCGKIDVGINATQKMFEKRCFGGFKHNYQSAKILTEIEEKYKEYPGLNVSVQVVAIADEIAQRGHDVDDALTSGVMTIDEFKDRLKIDKCRELFDRINKEINDIETSERLIIDKKELKISRIVSVIINYFIQKTIEYSLTLVSEYEELGRISLDNTKVMVRFPDDVERVNGYLEQVVQKKVICNNEVARADYNASMIVQNLFAKYYKNPRLLHSGTVHKIFLETLKHKNREVSNSAIYLSDGSIELVNKEIEEITSKPLNEKLVLEYLKDGDNSCAEKDIVILEKRRILVRAITDYIAGMTDGYALEEYEKLR